MLLFGFFVYSFECDIKPVSSNGIKLESDPDSNELNPPPCVQSNPLWTPLHCAIDTESEVIKQ